MRYTNKQLESMTDMELAADIIREKLAKLCNPYSPFASKLRRVYETLRTQAEHEKNIERITTAATDEIWGSLEQGPTGNYWIDKTHNLTCERTEYDDFHVQLEEHTGKKENFEIKRYLDSMSTDVHIAPSSQEALRYVLRRLISENANILDLSQTAQSNSGGDK